MKFDKLGKCNRKRNTPSESLNRVENARTPIESLDTLYECLLMIWTRLEQISGRYLRLDINSYSNSSAETECSILEEWINLRCARRVSWRGGEGVGRRRTEEAGRFVWCLRWVRRFLHPPASIMMRDASRSYLVELQESIDDLRNNADRIESSVTVERTSQNIYSRRCRHSSRQHIRLK